MMDHISQYELMEEEYRIEYDQVNHLEHIALFKWSLINSTTYDIGEN